MVKHISEDDKRMKDRVTFDLESLETQGLGSFPHRRRPGAPDPSKVPVRGL